MKPYYEDSHVTIYHGDCREILPVDADVLVTDPPYGISHQSNRPGAPLRGESIANDHDTEARDAVLAAWRGRSVVVFGTCKVTAPLLAIRGVLVWDKGAHVGMGDLSLPWKQNWEHIYISGPGFKGRRDSGVLHHTAIEPWGNRLTHPHEKPESLMLALLAKCPNGVVLDPFMGSGTTLVAAKRLNRKAIGIEIEERYCEIAAERLAQDVLPWQSDELPQADDAVRLWVD